MTGPILPETKTITIGPGKVTVPQYYYKVIYDLTSPNKMIGFILPNEGSDKPLRDFAVTEFLEYWNHYRVHEGLGGKMVLPYPQAPDGEVVEVSFLGGLLHGYKREKVAA